MLSPDSVGSEPLAEQKVIARGSCPTLPGRAIRRIRRFVDEQLRYVDRLSGGRDQTLTYQFLPCLEQQLAVEACTVLKVIPVSFAAASAPPIC